jgi:hypothetical protein
MTRPMCARDCRAMNMITFHACARGGEVRDAYLKDLFMLDVTGIGPQRCPALGMNTAHIRLQPLLEIAPSRTVCMRGTHLHARCVPQCSYVITASKIGREHSLAIRWQHRACPYPIPKQMQLRACDLPPVLPDSAGSTVPILMPSVMCCTGPLTSGQRTTHFFGWGKRCSACSL